MKNDAILLISDAHAPYHHPDTIPFLAACADWMSPTRVVNLGDECDQHALGRWPKDPDLPSAGDELELAQQFIGELGDLFPVMDLVSANHTERYMKRALEAAGIPRAYLRPYHQLWDQPGWRWHRDLTLTLPDGTKLYICHGKTSNVLNHAKQLGCSVIQGHHHTQLSIQYFETSLGRNFAAQGGCLIDDNAYAFKYNKESILRPTIGTIAVINSVPVLLPMPRDKHGRWTGEIE